MSLGRRLPLFVALSVMAHGALALVWHVPDSLVRSGSTLRVSLLPPRTREVRARFAAPSASTDSQRRASVPMETTPSAHAPLAATVKDNGASGDGDATRARASALQAVAAAPTQGRVLENRLASSLARYFYYPPVAIRYAWQGTVRIGLRIDRDGSISRIHLIRSSGYAVLDEAALRSTHRIKTLGTTLSRDHFDLQLPVVYRLAQG